MNPNELRQRAAGLERQAQELVTSVAGENRDMTEAERSVHDGYLAESDRLDRQAGEIEAIEARMARRGAAQPQARTSAPIENGPSQDDKQFQTGGFRSAGHFAHTLHRGTNPAGPNAEAAQLLGEWRSVAGRVTRAATGNNEASDAEGALLIPPQQAAGIWERSRQMNNLSSRVPMFPVAGNTMTFNADAETSRANGSRRGGVVGYWDAEAGQYVSSKPTFRKVELKLKKVTVLVFATDEMLEDSGGTLEAYIDNAASEEIAFKTTDALLNGAGAGIPLGLYKSACKVVAPKKAGQGNGTIVAENIDAMWASRHAPNEKNYIWLYNQEIEPQLQKMFYANGTATGQLVYIPEGGISAKPYATLKGREMVNTEQCPALGTEGDLTLWDPTQHVGIYKSVGVNKAASIHLRFDFGEVCFRFNMRIDAQCMWNQSLTPFKGSTARSPIITLASDRS